MKQYRISLFLLLAMVLTACSDALDDEVSMTVNVSQDENVQVEGDTIVVKKGEPVTFNFTGNPDNITFFSGEAGSKYEYRDRDQVDPEDVTSSTLSFSVWAQHGSAATVANVLKMYISDEFPGLDKNNFTADSTLVEKFAWNDLVNQSSLPQAPGSTAQAVRFNVDLSSYLGKRFAIAISYTAHDNSAAQPRINFVNMCINNVMKDGTTTTLYASDFGFTPVNMLCHYNLSDQKSMISNREYGTVTNNTSGIWNLTGASTGSFFIHSSNAKADLKYSWLVSGLIMSNVCSPDEGQVVKNISSRTAAYSYTYSNTGVYKASFLATNSNYKKESHVLREMNIKVVE